MDIFSMYHVYTIHVLRRRSPTGALLKRTPAARIAAEGPKAEGKRARSSSRASSACEWPRVTRSGCQRRRRSSRATNSANRWTTTAAWMNAHSTAAAPEPCPRASLSSLPQRAPRRVRTLEATRGEAHAIPQTYDIILFEYSNIRDEFKY